MFSVFLALLKTTSMPNGLPAVARINFVRRNPVPLRISQDHHLPWPLEGSFTVTATPAVHGQLQDVLHQAETFMNLRRSHELADDTLGMVERIWKDVENIEEMMRRAKRRASEAFADDEADYESSLPPKKRRRDDDYEVFSPSLLSEDELPLDLRFAQEEFDKNSSTAGTQDSEESGIDSDMESMISDGDLPEDWTVPNLNE